MANVDEKRFAQLKSDKFNEQILKIQKECTDVDPDIIASVLDECNYDMELTIGRIKRGEFQDGGWQTAKSNHKKKNHNSNEQIINGHAFSDSEHSLSQRTSPTSSFRHENRRNKYKQHQKSMRSNPKRNLENSDRNYFISSNKNNSYQKTFSSSNKQINEEIPEIKSSTVEEFANNNRETSIKSSSKHRTRSTIPQEPVSMHPAIKFSTQPIDIQFGDVEWNDSAPISINPSKILTLSKTNDNDEQDLSSKINNQSDKNDKNVSSSNSINQKMTNETTNQSIIDNTPSNDLPSATSHLSDHLTNVSSTVTNHYSSQEEIPISQITLNDDNNTKFSTRSSNLQQLPVQRDYSQPTHYGPISNSTMGRTGTYQLPTQQQYILPPYHSVSPMIYPVFPHATSYESYSYGGTNYVGTYFNQQREQYHSSVKYDRHSYDKDFFSNYGQSNRSNSDKIYQQPTNETHITSKLSPNAAAFTQGGSMISSPSTGNLYLNPGRFSVNNQYQNIGGSTHQDRIFSYSSMDNRDNRSGASYGYTNNRNNFYYHEQQRTNNNNASNSNWHVQQ